VMEIVEAGAPPAPGTDLSGLVRLNAAELVGNLGDVYAWARDLPIPTPGTVTAMHKIRKVKEALAAAPVAAQAGQVAVPAGWKLVPIEATDEMRMACLTLNYQEEIDAEWAAMVAAAPSPAKESK